MTQLYLVRHGETEWSRSGQHTSYTDLDLTEHGVAEALRLREKLDPADFGLVLSSPRLRARRTAELAGFTNVQVDERLREWDYGDYEGRTSPEIRSMQPGWRIWTHSMPKGETKVQIITRMTEVVNLVRASGVDRAICFGHGHSSRVLALCWLDIDIARGQSFPLKTASVSIVGYEKESPAIIQWNA
ncbi:MAG TPA: histidine phosphatase family protein [Propionibacteriaceae bacterium]|nr:histidine phosphatase family protein [Propionibacteriaceae bacterium]HPZ48235.1 histidine phosphatase family protein [Propionibacteriaceae bacterium]HQE30611.1 histidine phosphatase family protein [Propionibacteriaceae bacterium]